MYQQGNKGPDHKKNNGGNETHWPPYPVAGARRILGGGRHGRPWCFPGAPEVRGKRQRDHRCSRQFAGVRQTAARFRRWV